MKNIELPEELRNKIFSWRGGGYDGCFQERMPDGKNGMCGGIIFHGKRDNGGDGSGPTFSVCLEPTDGYSIHT